MKTLHTPGPWSYQFGKDQMVSEKTTVASLNNCFIFSDAATHGEKEADARLIAAAPDMLSFIERVYQGQRGELKGEFIASIQRQAKLLLEKAKGEKDGTDV